MLELIQVMLKDEELKKLIGSHIYPAQTDYLGDCVLYSYHTTLSNKITQQTRLQITIIAGTTAKTAQIEERIKYLILTYGDDPLTDNILQTQLNGGGTLYDSDRMKHHRILYFDILQRGVYKWQ